MILNLIGQINIIKAMNFKPNYSELAREYGIDRRTVKKYCEGYEGKPKTRNKPSKLDKYYDEIKANGFKLKWPIFTHISVSLVIG
jgi:predicted transcriptional regulator